MRLPRKKRKERFARSIIMKNSAPRDRDIFDSNRPGSNMRPLTFMPPKDQRAGDVDAGISTSDDADQKSKGEIVDRAAAEKIERHRRQEHGSRGDDGSA